MGYLKKFGTAVIYIGFFLAIITFLPGLPPEAEFSEYSIEFPREVGKRFELKNRLQGAEVLFSEELKGAETFDSYNGELYTGVHGGYVVKLENGRIVPVVKFGEKCDGIWEEDKCGRPLGLRFNSKGDLYVADAYYGIFQVNVKTGQYKNIVNSSLPIDGKRPKIPNSLDIAKNGDIYWTDSSTDFHLYDGTYTFLANPSGRLIRYNAATKQNEVLMTNLGFANGVKLSDDESFVIVLETLASRIMKYNLKGPKAGQQEIFAEALPGLPDNVDNDGEGGFLVNLIMYTDPEHPMLAQSLIPHPYIRKMLVRLLYLMELPFKLLQDIYPSSFNLRLMHSIGTFEGLRGLDTKKTSIVLRMDKAGNMLEGLYADDGTVHSLCAAFIHDGYLWLGSPFNEYVMRVPLKQAFPDLKLSEKHSSSIKNQKQSAEPRVTVTKTTDSKADSKATKPTTQKPVTEAPTTQKPITQAPTTKKPTTQAPTTQKPTTQAPKTQKPTTQAPTTQKPTTQAPRTEKPVKSSTADSAANKKPAAPAQNAKPILTTPPTIPKESSNQATKDKAKASSNSNAKSNTVNAKTESPNKAAVNTKPNESNKQNTRDTQSGKTKPMEKNQPKDDSTAK